MADHSEKIIESDVVPKMEDTSLGNCSICLDEVVKEDDCRLVCKHPHHLACIIQLKDQPRCPICRGTLEGSLIDKNKMNNIRATFVDRRSHQDEREVFGRILILQRIAQSPEALEILNRMLIQLDPFLHGRGMMFLAILLLLQIAQSPELLEAFNMMFGQMDPLSRARTTVLIQEMLDFLQQYIERVNI